ARATAALAVAGPPALAAGRVVGAAWRRASGPLVAALRPACRLLRRPAFRAVTVLGGLGLAVAGEARRVVGVLDRSPAGPLLRPAVGPVVRVAQRRPLECGMAGLAVAVAALVLVAAGAQPVPPLPAPRTTAAVHRSGFDASGMAQLALLGSRSGTPLDLAAASSPPQPAPTSVADLPPLRSGEVFGFAPYWTLDQSAGFDVADLTTIAYFAVDVNPDGTLDRSGSGWNGYQSEALADLVTRAHAAGDRVVLTVDDLSQPSLDALTSSTRAATTLASAVVSAVEVKNLDGVNLDFEGEGPGDQAGLTSLVGTVSAAVHAADPHYQVTMDTYASAAGDPGGFYDIGALAPEVDGFFVMAYDLNLRSSPAAASPLTSAMFSDQEAIDEYTAVVPAAKILLGLPFYGYDWPTAGGTMSSGATGPPTPVPASQVLAGGHPLYWDPVTETAWTSYLVGAQWHETYIEDPTSVYLAVQMARAAGLEGVGAWALGMDGGDAALVGALDGSSPPGDTVPGPFGVPGGGAPTPPPAPPAAVPAAPPTTVPPPGGASGGEGAPPGTTTLTSPSPTTSSLPAATTTTTGPGTTSTTTAGGGGAGSFRYSGLWQGQPVALARPGGPVPALGATAVGVGTLTGFQTTDPSVACLASVPDLPVFRSGNEPPGTLEVLSTTKDCVAAWFTFPAGA
ncbi:MAG: glycosyl hydrolase family 18 protein, partial [Acidimicrobiales bacterium]